MTETMRARQSAGYREKYAMLKGNKGVSVASNGHTIWTYTYSKYAEYQDANGAQYDATAHRWVG